MNFVTLSDKNYLTYGLTLYESIKANTDCDFTIHYLCLDDETYDAVVSIPEIVAYKFDDLKRSRNYTRMIDKKSVPNGLSEFHFSLAAFFCDYLVNSIGIKQDILYVDADIIFYKNPKLIFDASENSAVSLGCHKHIPLNKKVRNPGYFNVGAMYFSNEYQAEVCLSRWTDAVLTYTDDKWHPFNACYDQKFLELFDTWIDPRDVKIYDYQIGHIAPWNMSMMKFEEGKMHWYDNEGYVLNKGETLIQDIVFCHFAHFTPDYKHDRYRVDREGEWGNIMGHSGVKEIYDNYFSKCKSTKVKYGL